MITGAERGVKRGYGGCQGNRVTAHFNCTHPEAALSKKRTLLGLLPVMLEGRSVPPRPNRLEADKGMRYTTDQGDDK